MTLLNSTVCSLFGLFAWYCKYADRANDWIDISHYSFQAYLLFDLTLGFLFYWKDFTTPGVVHHIIYLIYEWFILNRASMQAWEPMVPASLCTFRRICNLVFL